MKKRKKLLISIFSIAAFVFSIFSFNLFKNANAMAIDNSISSTIDDISIVYVDNPVYSSGSNYFQISSSFDYNDYPNGLSSFNPQLNIHSINPINSLTFYDYVNLTFNIDLYFGYYDSNDESIYYQAYGDWIYYFYYDNQHYASDNYLDESYKPMFISNYGDNINTEATYLFQTITSELTNASDFQIRFIFDDIEEYSDFTFFTIYIYNIEVFTYSDIYNSSQFDNSSQTFYNDGYNTGYSSGYSNGYDLGNNNGYNNGFNSGYASGVAQYKDLYDNLVVEYNDLQELYNDYLEGNVSFNTLVWNIATIPFESFKQIWNVDLLGLNIGNFVTALMFVGVVVFIWKKFL